MRVIYRVREDSKCREFFKEITNVFKMAKKRDDWDLARLEVSEERARYITCCNNTWWVSSNGEFGYEGTREGFPRLQPFNELKWLDRNSYYPVLGIGEYRVIRASSNTLASYFIPRKAYELVLVEYWTTTPREWNMLPFDGIYKVGKDKAVIIKDGYPVRIVSYRNVYHDGEKRYNVLRMIVRKGMRYWEWVKEAC